jgi:1-acyl-sn-glycerol-3-phosphate acyltransferase
MSPPTAFLAALALLVSPWILTAPSPRSETGGVVRFLWWLNAFYCAFWHRFQLPEDDPLPAVGGAILISNHTSGIDHMLLQASTRRALGFVIAKELYDVPLHRPFCALIGCIPVKRDGRDLAATRAALRALGDGRVVPIFPEGHIIPTSGRELGEGKPGVAFLATASRVPVIPAYIWGTPETNNLGRSLRSPSHSRVVYGPPVDLSEFLSAGKVDRDRFDEVTARLMDSIRTLRNQVRSGEESGDGRRA